MVPEGLPRVPVGGIEGVGKVRKPGEIAGVAVGGVVGADAARIPIKLHSSSAVKPCRWDSSWQTVAGRKAEGLSVLTFASPVKGK